MGLIYGVSQVMNNLRVKLYKNHLMKNEDAYFARLDSMNTIGMAQLCATMVQRAGHTGNAGDLTKNGEDIMEEVAYQLCNGYTVNLGLFSLYLNVGGTFKSEHDTPDHKHHPLSLRVRTHKPFHRLVEATHVQIEGYADASGCIDQYFDEELGDEGHLYVEGHMFTMHGRGIQIKGDPALVGLYFVPVDDPSAAVKVTRIMENHPHKIIGIAPATQHQFCRLEIRTQYSTGSILLKAPRVISSPFVLEEA
jgi:hypothetical protein